MKVTGNASTNSGSATTTNRGYNTPVFSHQNLYTWGQCTYHVFNRRAEIGKVLVLIGGMLITGITQRQQMVTLSTIDLL
ncbi:N-acetylmuramoyl-L-alanine amidase [Staphylococcus aureus]|uniref:N-acetylmuramoyl-L-alanine amidase n=1 Tax=Staphylococcus aureus TaxID=1280 RepID=A0A380EG47_STAAU|nr:N-acetylmuramoyl-L-alanine amidase [Staphylococcus aureus]